MERREKTEKPNGPSVQAVGLVQTTSEESFQTFVRCLGTTLPQTVVTPATSARGGA